MILMVFYLESKYGKDWADPTTSTLNYTADEIAEGIDFIKSLVDGHVIMPLPTYYGANGDGATHQSNEWITGKIAWHLRVGFRCFQVPGRSGRGEQARLHRW